MRNLIIFGVLALALAGAANKIAARSPASPKPVAQANAAQPAAAQANAPGIMFVPRARDGHFHVDATIGGRQVPFMVDTGASLIALSAEEAQRLDLTVSRRDKMVHMQTANGVVTATKVRLASVDIGPLTVYDVDAVIMPKGALRGNLLGLSFLSRLRRYEFRSGQLVLEQ